MESLRSANFIYLTEFLNFISLRLIKLTLNFSSLQTLAAFLQAEPDNADLAQHDQVFKGKVKYSLKFSSFLETKH